MRWNLSAAVDAALSFMSLIEKKAWKENVMYGTLLVSLTHQSPVAGYLFLLHGYDHSIFHLPSCDDLLYL